MRTPNEEVEYPLDSPTVEIEIEVKVFNLIIAALHLVIGRNITGALTQFEDISTDNVSSHCTR